MLKAAHLTEIETLPDPAERMDEPVKMLVDLTSILLVLPYRGWTSHGELCTLRFKGTDMYVHVKMSYESFKSMLREQDAVNAIVS